MKNLFLFIIILTSISSSAQVYNLTDYKFSNRVNIGKGGTTFTPSNGNVVRVRNDGARWVITNK